MFSLRSLLWALLCALPTTWVSFPSALATSALLNDGLTDLVQWDKHSLLIDGQRIFLFTGEMHYWRIPVPELWRDILEKIKAAGFTGFTFYSSWAWHAFNSTTLDFESGAHDITKLYEIAKDVGLYFLLRPGPYINAEANAGGYPLWLTTGEYGRLRDNGTEYTHAYTPYIKRFAEISRPYLITNGGNGILFQIENEFGDQWVGNPAAKNPNKVAANYMTNLEKLIRDNGIDVPTYFNNPNMNTKSWSSDYAPGFAGNTDLNGVDSYPSCWTCNVSVCGSTNGGYTPYQVAYYYDYFSETNQNMPSFLPEFQGGSFNPWGGPQGGCPNDLGADYANLFYRHNIAEGVTAVNLYMMYGGTNWGSFATPVVATSYDYSAPISEDRSIGSKYYETKLLALFSRAAVDLTETSRVSSSTTQTSNAAILSTELRNARTNAAFYVTMHATSSSGTRESFKLHVNTSEGQLTIPRKVGSIVLNGHQSKIIPTDFSLGTAKLVYSTAEILTYMVTDGETTLFLWVPTGESAEFMISGAWGSQTSSGQSSLSGISVSETNSGTTVSIDKVENSTVFQMSNQKSRLRVVVMDRPTAYLSWAPMLTNKPHAPANESVYVQGPYLVRSASLNQNILQLTGDVNCTTTIEAYAPKQANTISWNGQRLQTVATEYGSLKAQVAGPKTVKLPALTEWKFADSLPEKEMNYDASGPAWIAADHLSTSNPTKPVTLPVLYADEYGFHNGPILWRGSFHRSTSGVRLSLQGGNAFGWSAWLNGKFIGSYLGDASLNQGKMTLSFSNATVFSNQENVLLVVMDNTGHDEQPDYLAPRGILEATLLDNGAKFSSWRVAGNAGGDRTQLDPVRGPLAEGGLTAERLGWHLPGFDASHWASAAPSAGFKHAGIRFYRTSVPLSMPSGLDVSISMVLSAPKSSKYRAIIYVNGYQYGRFSPWIGNQVEFPVPPGVLDYQGNNDIAVAVWAQSEEGAAIDVDWKVNYAVESSLDVLFDGSALRPAWNRKRLEYA
ncbi:beta-galactosidase [Acrodontium crateriforme]|uniref:beta-galactosidase n=1 Tax=Acrodontium crateriforme TaxID=150365 RepID=A0AAQ3MBK3_9PEZI|nr:beta-galactosidase [Acrodontium crateriforme]